MTFNSEIFSPNAANNQPSYNCILKNTRMLLVGFIGISLIAVGFLNMAQSIRANGKTSQFIQERYCGCGIDCLCGNGCGCSKNNLK